MARSITTRSTNPKIMDDNIKILDDALAIASAPPAEDVSYDNTDSGLTATDVQAAIDEMLSSLTTSSSVSATSYNEAVTIDLNKSVKVGKTIYLIIKGHYTGTMSNLTGIQLGVVPSVTGYSFPMGVGQEWNINSIGYSFIDGDGRITMSSNVTAGYFHICQVIPA